jgi:ribosomal protein S18 acetylase RimI-like enzyme
LFGVDTLTLRALTPADVPALAVLLAAIEAVDDTGENYSADDIAEELADSTLDLGRDTLGAVGPDGAFVGWAMVHGTATVRDVHRIRLEGGVLPARRGEGIGRRLLEWSAARGSELHRERHPDRPGALDVTGSSTVPSREALALAAGFSAVRWWYGMNRDLLAPPPVPPVPAGLRLVPYEADLDGALRLAHGEAFADHWGSVPPDEQRWAQWITGSRAFRPALSWLVLDGPAIAAYLLAYFFEADAAATGVREGYIGQIGTLAAYRRRGLGALLLANVLHRFRDEGYERAALDVDSGNPTGALGVYERAGFEISRRSVTWSRPVE